MPWQRLCGVSISVVNTKKNKIIKKEKYPGETEEIKKKELLKPVIFSLVLLFLFFFFFLNCPSFLQAFCKSSEKCKF